LLREGQVIKIFLPQDCICQQTVIKCLSPQNNDFNLTILHIIR
jgi:hypothetical protein